jgi:Cu2+-exporting ATPase
MAERIGDDGAATATAVADLRRGDLLLVRPGASIPADGTVEQGSICSQRGDDHG